MKLQLLVALFLLLNNVIKLPKFCLVGHTKVGYWFHDASVLGDTASHPPTDSCVLNNWNQRNGSCGFWSHSHRLTQQGDMCRPAGAPLRVVRLVQGMFSIAPADLHSSPNRFHGDTLQPINSVVACNFESKHVLPVWCMQNCRNSLHNYTWVEPEE